MRGKIKWPAPLARRRFARVRETLYPLHSAAPRCPHPVHMMSLWYIVSSWAIILWIGERLYYEFVKQCIHRTLQLQDARILYIWRVRNTLWVREPCIVNSWKTVLRHEILYPPHSTATRCPHPVCVCKCEFMGVCVREGLDCGGYI